MHKSVLYMYNKVASFRNVMFLYCNHTNVWLLSKYLFDERRHVHTFKPHYNKVAFDIKMMQDVNSFIIFKNLLQPYTHDTSMATLFFICFVITCNSLNPYSLYRAPAVALCHVVFRQVSKTNHFPSLC